MRIAVILSGALMSLSAFTDEGRVPLIEDQLTKNECSASHFAYPPLLSNGILIAAVMMKCESVCIVKFATRPYQ